MTLNKSRKCLSKFYSERKKERAEMEGFRLEVSKELHKKLRYEMNELKERMKG